MQIIFKLTPEQTARAEELLAGSERSPMYSLNLVGDQLYYNGTKYWFYYGCRKDLLTVAGYDSKKDALNSGYQKLSFKASEELYLNVPSEFNEVITRKYVDKSRLTGKKGICKGQKYVEVFEGVGKLKVSADAIQLRVIPSNRTYLSGEVNGRLDWLPKTPEEAVLIKEDMILATRIGADSGTKYHIPAGSRVFLISGGNPHVLAKWGVF